MQRRQQRVGLKWVLLKHNRKAALATLYRQEKFGETKKNGKKMAQQIKSVVKNMKNGLETIFLPFLLVRKQIFLRFSLAVCEKLYNFVSRKLTLKQKRLFSA